MRKKNVLTLSKKYIRDITAFVNWTEGNELTKAEYERLLKEAKSKKNQRLYLIMQTICATGIRVSELKYVDVNSVMTGHSNVNTTRIYTIEDGTTHRRQMQRMGLVRMQN